MWWKDYSLRLRALFFRRRMDEELEEELQLHIDMQARKNQQHESDTADGKRHRARPRSHESKSGR